MKKMGFAAAIVAGVAGLASADVYNDNVGNHLAGGDLHDFFASQGFNHLDIISVTVTNDAQFLYFDLHLNADLDATNWGTYAVGISTGDAGGSNSNAWGRNIDWQRDINYWIGTWANDGGSGIGGQLWQHAGSWNQIAGLASSDASQHGTGHQIFAVDFTLMGLAVGDTIELDVISSGGVGNPPGVDHLSSANFTTDDWGRTSFSGTFVSYTLVPAPGAAALLGLGGLIVGRRRR